MMFFHCKHRQILSGGILLMLLMALVACQKSLEMWPNYLKTTFNIHFDWSDTKDASPSEMQLVAFEKETATPLEFGFVGNRGGQVELKAGSYNVLAFNSDTETLYGKGDAWETYELASIVTELTRINSMFANSRVVPRGVGSEDEPVILQPDMAWTTALEEMMAGDNESEDVTLPMQPAVYTYRFNISKVENLSYVSDLTATISGMSGSMWPATGKPSDTHCTMPVTLTIDGDSNISIVFRSFGHCPSGKVEARHILVVYAVLQDHSKWYYEFDVTDVLHDEAHLHPASGKDPDGLEPIELEHLPFPKPLTNGSGLHPDVEDWYEISVSIIM